MKRNRRFPIVRLMAVPAAAAVLAVLLATALGWTQPAATASAQSATGTTTPATTPASEEAEIRAAGTYTVQVGDSWNSVAARTGVSVAALQAANPRAMRTNEWLLVGETLVVPAGAPAISATGTVTATQLGQPQRHVVQLGESWNSIAAQYGVTRRLLQAANPQALRPNDVLYRGDVLVIPPAETTEADDETTTATAAATTAATATATPSPEPTVTPEPTATLNPTATPEPTLTLEPTATAEPSATPAATATTEAGPEELTAGQGEAATEPAAESTTESTAEAETAPTVEAAETPTEVASAGADVLPSEIVTASETLTEEAGIAEEPVCPAEFAAYPDLLAGLINSPAGGVEGVLGFLRQCTALDEENVQTADWTDDGTDDLALVIMDPRSDAATPQTDLLLFTSNGERYDLAYRARAAGDVRILAAEDINEDGMPDIAWVDTTCGASTCFDTINVRSWNGTTWADWTDQTITMAYAEVELAELRDTAQGQEIQLMGGVYGSVGAGPQRGRTEIWGSVDGGPYVMIERVYDRSSCLYHKVLDANEALQRYQEIGLVQAREMYTEAVTNRNLTTCWEHENELEELRSFSLLRLALISAYEGDPAAASENIDQLQQAYPESIFAPLGQAWLDAYQPGNDIAAACAAATQFASDNPISFESLSDYGYANPTLRAEDLCPLLNIDVPVSEETATGEVGEAEAATEAAIETATEAAAEPTASAGDESGTEPGSSSAEADASLLGLAGEEGELPECPTSLDVYASVLPDVIAVSEADSLIVETWLRLCDGMADDRGGMLMADVNDDGVEDAIFLPTIVSDLGFGPEGTQGAILVYHGQAEGGYELAYAPEIFGQPTMIGTGDFNGDGRSDVAWAVEGCSTFCVKEIQVLTWDPDAETYVTIIEPGATIAEGTATFEELPAEAMGTGQQLLLQGGVSGTSDGGLEVAHTEVWQAVDGRTFRRLSWTYDREARGNDCLGLRLIEADAALHASDLLGYAPAADLYTASLDPALRACSIYGIPGDQELFQLRGLAHFRLIQTQALSGTLEAAEQTLAAMTEELPESSYTQAATQWLAEYARSGSSAVACNAVQTIFDRDTVTWQVTDHFGYNHPALAAEQVCFIPAAEEPSEP